MQAWWRNGRKRHRRAAIEPRCAQYGSRFLPLSSGSDEFVPIGNGGTCGRHSEFHSRPFFLCSFFFVKPQASSSRMHRTNFRFLCLIIRLICKSLPPRRRAMPIDNSRCPPRFPLRYSARRYTHCIGMVPSPCFPYSNSTRID